MNNRSLIQQIEFYFSDINLSTDVYLQSIMDLNGMVPLEVITKFKMIKKFGQTNEQIIKEIQQSKFLQLSNDNKMLGRTYKSPIAQIEKRGLKIKWIPCCLTEEEILKILNQFGEVDQMKMKFIQGSLKFKGTVEVLFKSIETVNELKEMPKVMIKNKEVIIKKWKTGTVWVRVSQGSEKIDDIKGIVDEENGSVVFEIPKGKIQKILKLKDLMIEYITCDEYIKVLQQLKRVIEFD